MEGVFRVLIKSGASAVHISVAKKNTSAQKLYASKGFKVVGEATMYGNDYYLEEKDLTEEKF